MPAQIWIHGKPHTYWQVLKFNLGKCYRSNTYQTSTLLQSINVQLQSQLSKLLLTSNVTLYIIIIQRHNNSIQHLNWFVHSCWVKNQHMQTGSYNSPAQQGGTCLRVCIFSLVNYSFVPRLFYELREESTKRTGHPGWVNYQVLEARNARLMRTLNEQGP